MPSCSVTCCKNRSEKKNYVKDGITYHLFPSKPILKEKWIDATRRGPNWFPRKNSVICSNHFEETCFQPYKKSRRLFDWAVPTIKLYQVILTTTLTTSDDCSNENLSKSGYTCAACGHQIIKSEPGERNETTLTGDCNNILENPSKPQNIIKCERMIQKQRTKIKSLQKKNNRYLQRIKKLQNILKELNEKKIYPDLNIFVDNLDVDPLST